MKKLKLFSSQRRKACLRLRNIPWVWSNSCPLSFKNRVFLFCKIQRLCHRRMNFSFKQKPFHQVSEEEAFVGYPKHWHSSPRSSFIICLSLLQIALIKFKSTRFRQDPWHNKASILAYCQSALVIHSRIYSLSPWYVSIYIQLIWCSDKCVLNQSLH